MTPSDSGALSAEPTRARPWARGLARASWSLAACALLVAGVLGKVGASVPWSRLPQYTFVVAELVLGLLGAALGALALLAGAGDARGRRTALFGTSASVVVIVIVLLASLAGARSSRQTEDDLRRATNDALHARPGWNGGARLDGLIIEALEIDAGSDLAKILTRVYDRPSRFFFFGADNRAGTRDVVIDTGGAVAHRARGADANVAAPAELVRVPAGGRLTGVPVLFPPDASFRDVDWIEIRIDGVPRRLAGRYFSVAEKRAIDEARAGADPRP